MTNKRILFVIGTLDVGGAETHLVRIARELKQRAWQPTIFVLIPGGPLTGALVDAGIPILGISAKWFNKLPFGRAVVQQIVTLARIAFAMRKLKPAVCHFFLPTAYLFGGIAARIARIRPCIMSRRSLRNYQSNYPIYTFLEHRLHHQMDRVCGNSRAVVTQLAEEGVPADRLRLIYNGIDCSAPLSALQRDEIRAELDIPLESLVLCIVANLIPYKGHADLIDALAIIASDLPRNWVLLCAGRDDGIGMALHKRAAAAGLDKNVRWLGARRDVPRILAASDIALLCSHQEGFSNAVLEAMAAGLPMVVTDVGGNAEAVLDGVTGYVVPSHNPPLLAKSILKLALDAQRSEMGQRGRQRVEQEFSLTACVDAYEALYKEVC